MLIIIARLEVASSPRDLQQRKFQEPCFSKEVKAGEEHTNPNSIEKSLIPSDVILIQNIQFTYLLKSLATEVDGVPMMLRNGS